MRQPAPTDPPIAITLAPKKTSPTQQALARPRPHLRAVA
jgi:hypothetical protein